MMLKCFWVLGTIYQFTLSIQFFVVTILFAEKL